jgi:hypothetical protein
MFGSSSGRGSNSCARAMPSRDCPRVDEALHRTRCARRTSPVESEPARGVAEVTVNENLTLVHENKAVYIPIGAVHRLSNPGMISLELIEVQVGSTRARTTSSGSRTSMDDKLPQLPREWHCAAVRVVLEPPAQQPCARAGGAVS